MARTTIRDRMRKNRIREREYRQLVMQVHQLENLSPELKSELKKLIAANEHGKVVAPADVASWKELRKMGAVREDRGQAVITSMGVTAVSEE